MRSRTGGNSGPASSRSILQPFVETARLLYEGPWVAERYAAIRSFIEKIPAHCIR